MKQILIDKDQFKITEPSLVVHRLCSFPIASKYYDNIGWNDLQSTIKLIDLLMSLHKTTVLSQNRELFYKNQFSLDVDNFTISKEEGKPVYYIDLCTIDNIIPTKEWLISFTNTVKLHEEEL